MLERIYVEIGNICNLSCSFCAGTSRPKRQMTAEEFDCICGKIKPHTKYIYLHVMGEPLLHKELDTFLKIAKNHELPVCITTNGTLLSQRGNILLENSEIIHKVSISLHAPEGSGYTDLDKYLKEVVDFSKYAASVGIYVVFRLWNCDSAEGKGENFRNAYIEEYLHKEYSSSWQTRPKGYRLSTNTFLEYDGIFTWPSKSTADKSDAGFCHGLSSQLAILADGCVVPCCLDSEGEMELGNIFSSSLEEILSGERAVKIKSSFASGQIFEELCKKCTFARKFKIRNN